MNDVCSSPELSVQCESFCNVRHHECLADCDEISCTASCNRDYADCFDQCPCNDACPEGCPCLNNFWCCQEKPGNAYQNEACVIEQKEQLDNCLSKCSVFEKNCHEKCTDKYNSDLSECPCFDNCQDGCPCDKFDCDDLSSPKNLTIYALDSVSWAEKEFLVSVRASGLIETQPMQNFQGLEISNTRYRCAFTLNNQLHLVGGAYDQGWYKNF